jgi:hypothetical protein
MYSETLCDVILRKHVSELFQGNGSNLVVRPRHKRMHGCESGG